MLTLKVYDHGNEIALTFEHSLLALSKWEAKTHTPYLTRGPKSAEEMIDYYRAMLTSPEHDPDLVYRLAPSQMEELDRYINDPQTASSFPANDEGAKLNGEVITSDTLYMQMVILKIPFEAATWHLNRLTMLIAKVSSAKTPPKKEDKATALTRWQEMSRRNRERFKSNG